jgi:Na+/H+ antiporter NhaC
MKIDLDQKEVRSIDFYGGSVGAIIPFFVFVIGVIIIALSGAPDERGFWPILLLALAVGLFLAKDKNNFSETVIEGMSQKIVMIMITAWILASTIGILMQITGLVDALIWISGLLNLSGSGFVVAAFVICCIVSLSTGSSFATILICTPILYPSGGLLGAHLPMLAGAIIGGATFGDFIAPISDTTIASALSQKAEIGPTVKSRIKYIVPAVIFTLAVYFLSMFFITSPEQSQVFDLSGSPKGLPMLLVPVLIIVLFLKGKHLLYGLLGGLVFGVLLGLTTGLLPTDKLFSLDLENYTATSFIIDGINRAVGISFFTILLMGLVATLKASGLVNRLVTFAAHNSKTKKQAEVWISGTVSAAVLLTTHSIVAILTVAEFANKTGNKMGISARRRANILSLVCCFFPFVLPYFIPVILMSNMTSSGSEFGIPKIAALQVGLYNFVSWGLLAVLILVVIFGLGDKGEENRKSYLIETSHEKQGESKI